MKNAKKEECDCEDLIPQNSNIKTEVGLSMWLSWYRACLVCLMSWVDPQQHNKAFVMGCVYSTELRRKEQENTKFKVILVRQCG